MTNKELLNNRQVDSNQHIPMKATSSFSSNKVDEEVECSDCSYLSVYAFIQRPGETVYIPPNWTHATMNLETSVAVTHNFFDPNQNGNALQSAM
jgi:ribosomal protein L16 Arg81 hydroxylase